MNQYLKHVASLEHKRESKKRVREQAKEPADFALLCTGGSGVGSASADLGDAGVEVFDDVSSAAASASQMYIDNTVDSRIEGMREELTAQINKNFIDVRQDLRASMKEDLRSILSDLLPSTAPQLVPVSEPLVGAGNPSPLKPPCGRKDLEADREEPVLPGPSNPPSVPLLSPQAADTLKTLDSVRASGVLSPEAYVQAIVALPVTQGLGPVAPVVPGPVVPDPVDPVGPSPVPSGPTGPGAPSPRPSMATRQAIVP